MVAIEQLKNEAVSFLLTAYHELGKSEEELENRLTQVKYEINHYGSYEHKYEELAYGAKMAWRNSNKCIGRLFWDSLHVFDERQANSEEVVFKALQRHISFATNNGKIRPVVTIFKPFKDDVEQIKILNHQLIRYAGYETKDGVIGDPASISFTKYCQELGWKGKETNFDILPIVLQLDYKKPRWFNLPKDNVLEVPISHPDIAGVEDLNIKWYGVPIISDMMLEIGGIKYTAAPFNGWYMGTEIGARNLADTKRYNLLPRIASIMNLDIRSNSSLWRDRALVELNIAVLYSFKKAGVSIVDHHTAAQQFKRFEQNEREKCRHVTGDWTWLIPPVSPATTHIFHKNYENKTLKPNFFYQKSHLKENLN